MDFFQAARLADHTVLATVATVGLNPRTEGAVQDFELVSMGDEQRHPLGADGANGRVAVAALAVQSLTPRGQPDVEIAPMRVEMVVKPVTVQARVRTPDGRTVPRILVFTFTRASAVHGGNTLDGRWIITGLRQP